MKTKILVTGSNGMLGKSLQIKSRKYNEEFIFVHRQFGDLTIDCIFSHELTFGKFQTFQKLGRKGEIKNEI